MPELPRDVRLQQKCDAAKVIEDDENVHSRIQKQINYLLAEVRQLIRDTE